MVIRFQNLISYICLATAGMGLFISGLATLFHGWQWWMSFIIATWAICIIRLVQTHRSARYTPRCCEDCGFKMVRVNQGERFLSKAQMIEEKLLSREYDLWVCTCGSRQMFSYPGPRAATFRKCTNCSVTAMYGISQIVKAEGVFLSTHCAACDAKVDVE